MANIDPITTVYNHLKNIGISTENSLWITTDLQLVQKSAPIVRIIHTLAYKIFGWQLGPSREIASVIQTIKTRTASSSPELAEQGAFIVTALEALRTGKDPQLEKLKQENRRTDEINKLAACQEIKSAPKIEPSTPEEQPKDAAVDVVQSKACVVEVAKPSNAKANEELIKAVRGSKREAAVLGGLLFAPLGLLMAAVTIPETEADLENIDNALKQGADIDYQEEGWGKYTALLYAAYYGYPSITKHLLKKGASPEIKDDFGYTPYAMAKYYLDKKKEEINFLDRKDENYKKRLENCQETIRRYEKVVKLLEAVTKDKTVPI